MTGEVSLRDVQASDLPVFFAQQLDPDATRMAAFPSRDHDAFMAHWARCMTDGTTILKTIVFDGIVAGNIVYWEEPNELKIGYWLGRDFWRRGIASAALAQFLGIMTVRPLYARVAKNNIASIHVLQKCGFTVAGEDTFRGIDGQPESEWVMVLTGRQAGEE